MVNFSSRSNPTTGPSARARTDPPLLSKNDPGGLVPEIAEVKRPGMYIVDFVVEPEVCALERSGFPSRAGASGSHHLPWALPRILQVIPKIKRIGGRDCPVGRGCGAVC